MKTEEDGRKAKRRKYKMEDEGGGKTEKVGNEERKNEK